MINIKETKRSDFTNIQMIADYMLTLISTHCDGMSELYDYGDINAIFCYVSILCNGDWKRMHSRADYLIDKEIGYVSVEKKEVGESNSDDYEAIHKYVVLKSTADKIKDLYVDDDVVDKKEDVLNFIIDTIGEEYNLTQKTNNSISVKVSENDSSIWGISTACDLANVLIDCGFKSNDSIKGKYNSNQIATMRLSLRYHNVNVSIFARGDIITLLVY